MIIPIYQRLGQSSHRIAQSVGDELGEPATHTGTLDPMAEGVLVVLTGEDRFKKSEYSHWQKTYQFSSIWGVATDSLDVLGLITQWQPIEQIEAVSNLESKTRIVFPQLLGQRDQIMPAFSAKRIAGESYFDLAKRGEPVPTTTQSITIHSLDLLRIETISSAQLLTHVSDKIGKVSGDFRQEACLARWQDKLTSLLTDPTIAWPVFHWQATVSHRTYMRALVRDMSQLVGMPSTTFSITRTQNGKYSIADCQLLEKV